MGKEINPVNTSLGKPVVDQYCYHVVLVSQLVDWQGYTTYVFKNLDDNDIYTKYFMCVRFPHWDHRSLGIGEAGYVLLKYVKAGISVWYKNKEFIEYNYDNVVFIKFVNELSEITDNDVGEIGEEETEIGEGTKQ